MPLNAGGDDAGVEVMTDSILLKEVTSIEHLELRDSLADNQRQHPDSDNDEPDNE